MKLAIFGDLHIGIRRDSTDWHNVAYEWADDMIKNLREHDVKDIVFLGDFFHNRSMISVNTLDAAGKFIRKFKDFNLHMILGNHDLFYDKEFTTSGVNLLNEAENIKVYTEPTHHRFGSKDVLFCGWGYDPLLYSADILFTHAEVSTFMTRRNQERLEGYKMSDLLSRYELVYSGHYHMRQKKEYERGSVRYVGNPFPMDFSDDGLTKGFDIYDTETEETIFIENKISPKYHAFKLSRLIKFRDFEKLSQLIENSYFKVVIDKNITLQDIDKLLNLLKAHNPKDVTVEWENGKDFVQNVEDYEVSGFDVRNAMEEYIDLLDVADKPWIKRYIVELYEKVDA